MKKWQCQRKLGKQLQMNSSDAFSDYMVSYSVNRSINISPTMGRLHKHREASTMGPTICLINRSREKIEESTAVEEKEEELIVKIFMLSMEVDRLNEENRQLRADKQERSGIERLKQASFMKEENQRLKLSTQRKQNIRSELEKQYQKQVFELREKIAACEAQNRTLNRRVRQNQKQLEELQLKGRINESAVSRAKMEASRMMEMSMRFDSTNVDLHKSIAKEKTMEVESLREKVQRCEEIIRDQKFIISGQKDEIAKDKGKQIEIEQLYQRQLDLVRKQLEQSQREGTQINQQEVKKLQSQIKDWQSRVVKSQEELKDKCLIIANQVKIITEKQDRCNELERLVQDIQFSSHSRLIRAQQAAKLATKQKQRQSQKMNKQIMKYQEEIEVLKTVIEQYKTNIAQKDTQVQMTTYQIRSRLKEKEQQIRKLRRRSRQKQSEAKMGKSLSVDSINISNKLRSSQVNLGHIVNSVMQLKDSTDRSTKIIGRSFAIAKEAYYAK